MSVPSVRPRGERLLLLLLLLSLGAYLAAFVSAFAHLPLSIPPWHQGLLLCFHGVPMFCLQFLLCRRARLPARLLLPLAALLLPGVWFLSLAEWHITGWLLCLCWCVSPALGSALAWAVWALGRRSRRAK